MKSFLGVIVLFFCFSGQVKAVEKSFESAKETFFDIGRVGFYYANKMSGIIFIEKANLEKVNFEEIEKKWQEFVQGKINVEFTDENLYDHRHQPMTALSFPDQRLTRIHRPSWNTLNNNIRLRLRLIFHEVLRQLEVENPLYNDENFRISQRMTIVTYGPVSKALEQKINP